MAFGSMTQNYHLPVLADALGRLMAGRTRVVDGTVGGGGHTARFRAAGSEVLAVDRDPDALAAARARLGDEGIVWRCGTFADDDVLQRIAQFRPEGIVLDLGVSSWQLDTAARGFSFRPGVPLDMRMSQAQEFSAADVLNHWSAPALTDLFRNGGDEPRARRLARAIVERRENGARFATSDDLVGAIRRALGPQSGPTDFARLFQAVRIAVNQELDLLSVGLPCLRDALANGGMLAVLTYHSGEDRIVKHAFWDWARDCVCPPHQPVCTCRGRPLGTVVTRRPTTASAEEIAANPRARSARLRAFQRDDGR